MIQFWWVNHSQTVRQEVDGQYLWSPKTERNGARSEFYNNMRRASPGDLVLSYSDRAVRFVGRVAEFAFSAPKPTEFGRTGSYWNNDGWLLPIFWTPVEPPVYPKSVISVLGPLLPSRYSPIHPTSGVGNQKAYLAAIPQAAFDLVMSAASCDRHALAAGGSNSLNFQVVRDLLDDALERSIFGDLDLSATERETLTMARRGQGVWGTKEIPSGFFDLPGSEHVSAVLFTNSGTISKFNRMGQLAGFGSPRLQLVRTGTAVNHDADAVAPVSFERNVRDPGYSETWLEGIDVWHNPKALHPIDPDLLPGVAHHWLLPNGQVRTLIPPWHPLGSFTVHSIADDADRAASFV